MTVLTQLSKAAGIAISASFPAYAKEDGGVNEPRKSRVSERVVTKKEPLLAFIAGRRMVWAEWCARVLC